MGSRATAALLLLTLALAGSAWLWMRSGSEPSRRTRVSATGVPERSSGEEPAELARPTLGDRGDTGPERRTVHAPASRVVERETPDHEHAASEAEAPVVRGRVIDRDGRPVPGARIYVSNSMAGILDYEGDDAPSGWMRRATTRSGADGTFVLRGPLPGSMRLLVRAKSFAPYDRREIPLPPGESVELDPVVMSHGAILSGRVVDASGIGVGGAELVSLEEGSDFVFAFPGQKRPALAVCEPDGSFRLDEIACGAWRLLVRSDEHPHEVAEGLAERPGEEVSGILIELDPADVIAGTVADVPKRERNDLEVRATPVSDSFGVDSFLGARTVDVAADMKFTLRGLRAGGSYDLQLRHKADPEEAIFFGGSRSRRVRAAAGERGIVLHYQPAASLTFQAIDAKSGAPLTEFLVSSGVEWTRPLMGDDKRPLLEHPEGRVLIDDLRPASENDRVKLQIQATGYESYERSDLAVVVGDTIDLGRIYLEPKPVVRVTVLDAESGAPVAQARVSLARMPDPVPSGERRMRFEADVDIGSGGHFMGGGARQAQTDEKGVALVTSLEGETCNLKVSAAGFAPAEITNLYLPAGELIDQVVRLTRGGKVEITVYDAQGLPLAGARIDHRDPSEIASTTRMMTFGASHRPTITDSGGRVVFENLMPGVHEFRMAAGAGPGAFLMEGGEATIQIAGAATADEDSWSPIEVEEGALSSLVLHAAPRGSLAGRVREAGRPLAGATLTLREESSRNEPTLMLPGMQGGPEARTDGDGEYLFADVEEGRYTLVVEHPTRRMPVELEVEIEGGENERNIDLGVAILAGRITDEMGEPLPGLRVTVEEAAPRGRGRSVSRAFVMIAEGDDAAVTVGGPSLGEAVYSDEDGRYELRGVVPDRELVVKAEGGLVQPGSSETVSVSSDEVRGDVNFQMEAGGAIEVEATLPDGSPARFCLVRANYAGDDDEGIEPKVGFIRSGSTTLKGLRPGPWAVSVERAGPTGDDAEPLEQEIEVKKLETAGASFRLD